MALPLQLVLEVKPFIHWGMDFIGPINPPSSVGHKYILIVTNYFIESGIINRFRCPMSLVCDNGATFAYDCTSMW